MSLMYTKPQPDNAHWFFFKRKNIQKSPWDILTWFGLLFPRSISPPFIKVKWSAETYRVVSGKHAISTWKQHNNKADCIYAIRAAHLQSLIYVIMLKKKTGNVKWQQNLLETDHQNLRLTKVHSRTISRPFFANSQKWGFWTTYPPIYCILRCRKMFPSKNWILLFSDKKK